MQWTRYSDNPHSARTSSPPYARWPRGTNVRELTAEIHHRLGLENEAMLPVLWYFTEAFGLTLPEVLPIREWIGTDRDEEIDALIMPSIAKAKENRMDAGTETQDGGNGKGFCHEPRPHSQTERS